jgi:predicted DNA-binding ribbon-helix-helix protein
MKGHGGKREGAGRPKKTRSWSEKFKDQLWKSLQKEAKAQGMSVFDAFAKKLFNEKVQDTVFASLWKSLCEVMAAKESHQTIEDKRTGPVIGLPAIKQPQEGETYPQVSGRPN